MKRKYRKTLAIILIITLVWNLFPNIPQAMAGSHADYVIDEIEELPEEIMYQQVPFGTGIGELELPDSLKMLVRAADEDEDEDTETATASKAQAQKDTEESIKTASPSQADADSFWIAVPVRWVLDERSGKAPEYNGEVPGTYRFDAELTSDRYIIGDAVLPMIEAEVLEEEAGQMLYSAMLLTAEDGAAAVTAEDGTLVGSYETLQEAVDAAAELEGSAVTLLDDLTLTGNVEISAGDFTIDLAGHRIARTAGNYGNVLAVTGGTEIRFTDSADGGIVENESYEDGSSALYVSNGAVVVDGGTWKALTSLYMTGGEVTVQGGSFTAKNSIYFVDAVRVDGGTLIVEDGDFDGSGVRSTLAMAEAASVVLKGGSYIPGKKTLINYRGAQLDLSQYPDPTELYFANMSGVKTTVENITLPDGYTFADGNGNSIPTDGLTGSEVADRTIYICSGELDTFTADFDANGGSGTMDSLGGIKGVLVLPECGFTPPEGALFRAWSVDGIQYAPGEQVVLNSDITVTALWMFPAAAVIAADGGTEIGSYETIQEAVDAAAENPGAEVKLLRDVSSDDTIWLNDGGSYVIDINGKTVNFGTVGYFCLENGSQLVVEDTAETKGTVSGPSGIFRVNNGCTLTIAGESSYRVTASEGVVRVGWGGTAIIEGGSFHANSAWSRCIQNLEMGTLIINGGTFDGDGGQNIIYSGGSVVINGGKLQGSCSNGMISYAGGTIDLSGYPDSDGITIFNWTSETIAASFSSDEAAILLPQNYWLTDGNGSQETELLPYNTRMVASFHLSTVTFDSNGGSGEMEAVTDVTGAYTLPECGFVPPEGMWFMAWFIDGEEYEPGETYRVKDDVTVKAVWTDGFTVSFDADGGSGSMEAEDGIYGDYSLPECGFTPPEGYMFKAWSVDGLEYAPGDVCSVKEDITVTAVWEIQYYRVSFYANGGSGTMETVEVPYGDYVLPECGFTPPEGKMFEAWMTANIQYQPGQIYQVRYNVRMSAVWTAETYTVSFDPGGGSGEMEAVKGISPGSAVTLPLCEFTPPAGKQFKSWSIEGTEYAPGDKYRPGSTLTVTAVWETIPASPVASVTTSKGAPRRFTDLQEAFDYAMTAVGSGSVITLLSDVNLSETITVDGKSLADRIQVTVDLGGYTVSCEGTGGFEITSRAEVVFEGSGTMESTENVRNNMISVRQNSDVTIKDGRYAGVYKVVELESGSLTIDGGTFICTGTMGECYFSVGQSGGSVTVNGGSFYGDIGIRTARGSEITTINGGSFFTNECEIWYADGKIDLTGNPDPGGMRILSYSGTDVDESHFLLPEAYCLWDSETGEEVHVLGVEKTVIIDRFAPEVTNISAETYLGEVQTSEFGHGDVITVKASAGSAVETLSLQSETEPAGRQMALYYYGEDGLVRISDPVYEGEDGFYTMTYDTAPGPVPVETEQTLRAAYIGYESHAGSYGEVTVTISHSYDENGICKANGCNAYEPAVLNGNVYEISNPGQLMWFAAYVNSGNPSADGRMLKDIDLSPVTEAWSPIGAEDQPYTGAFDGGSHRISHLVISNDKDYQGFIGVVGGGASLTGLVLDDTCEIENAGDYSAALIGGSSGSGTITITRCGNEADVTAGRNAAGIFGVNMGTAATVVITDCYNTGDIYTTDREAGAISGWVGRDAACQVVNCWNSGTVTGYDCNSFFRGTNTTVENCYQLDSLPSGGVGDVSVSAEQISSGELAWLLNGGKLAEDGTATEPDSDTWKQTLGEDPHPGFTGGTVYLSQLCDGSTAWSNEAGESGKPEHRFDESGRCIICGTQAAVSVAAETGGNTEFYPDIESAWEAAREKSQSAGQVKIILLTDVETSQVLTVGSGESLSLYGEEYTLSGSVNASNSGLINVAAGGSLTVVSGTVQNGSGGTNGMAVNGGTLTVQNGVITAEASGNSGICVYSGTLLVEDGVITGAYGVAAASGRGTITVSGGEITGKTYAGLFVNSSSSKAVVSGGTFRGGSYGLDVERGTALLSGGVYSGTTASIKINSSGLNMGSLLDSDCGSSYYYVDGNGKEILIDSSGWESLKEFKTSAGYGTVVVKADSEEVISVSVEWGEMAFTYSRGEWNQETHTYENGGWQPVDSTGAADENANKITVTNHGKTSVVVVCSFAEESGLTQIAGLAASFWKKNDESEETADSMVEAGTAESPVILESAGDGGTENAGSTAEIWLRLSSEEPEGEFDGQLGTVTVTISSMSESTVMSEAEPESGGTAEAAAKSAAWSDTEQVSGGTSQAAEGNSAWSAEKSADGMSGDTAGGGEKV